jgi:hypothetical protein
MTKKNSGETGCDRDGQLVMVHFSIGTSLASSASFRYHRAFTRLCCCA